MSNPNSPTLNEVVEYIVEEVLRERAEQENQETVPEEVRQENEEIEVKAGDATSFYSKRGAYAFKKYLIEKGFVEKKGFKKLVRLSRR